MGMLRRIGDRFLRDAIKTGADAWRQIVDRTRDGKVKSGAAFLKTVPARHQAFETEAKAEFLDVGRPQAHQRAAQRRHHARGGARDAAAFLVERRTFALGGMGGGCGLRRDRGERLAEFVVQFAGKMTPLFVLHGDEFPRQGVALGQRGLQLLGERVEDVGNGREFGKIETRQPRGKVVGRKLLQPGANGIGRPQRARQRGVDREAKPRQRESHDRKQAARLAPALADLGGRVEGRDRHAPRLAADAQRPRDRFAGMEDGAIQRRVTSGDGNFIGERAAANALAKAADLVPIGDAEAGFHQRRGDPVEVRRSIRRQRKPLRLRQLQRDIPGDGFGDQASPDPGGAVAVEQRIGRDREEANRGKRRDAQCQPQLQIDGAHGARHEIKRLLQALFHRPGI